MPDMADRADRKDLLDGVEPSAMEWFGRYPGPKYLLAPAEIDGEANHWECAIGYNRPCITHEGQAVTGDQIIRTAPDRESAVRAAVDAFVSLFDSPVAVLRPLEGKYR